MPFSKTRKSARLRSGMKRPWRSKTLTGTATRPVLTRTTSPSATSSGPGSTTATAAEFDGDAVGGVPAQRGGSTGRSGGSSTIATSSRDDETPTRRGREPGSEARVEVVVVATGAEAFTPGAGALTNGSTLFVPAPEVPADIPVEVAVAGEGREVLDESELALSVSPGCVAVVDCFTA